MYFKKLEIFGFKSFADKTVFNFEPGITAIIGPNGCGKSNVFDAIRWVLGEQSVKELRGSSMEDVIFNGTDSKPGLGFAEVSLTFSNESRMLPVDYNEVTVTRRLFRSGESEYLLNKTQVRLKDISELFMGTGIGAEAYSLVQQGKVDLVVSSKPEERRIILDEASGITKYKVKRKEALNKLKETEYNLLRINDIVTEVKRQIATVERQANKARRYKEEFEKLKIFEVKFANGELEEVEVRRKRIHKDIETLKTRESDLIKELNEFNDVINNEGSFLEELEDKINEVTGEDIKLDGQIDINYKQIGFNEERLENINTTQARIVAVKEQLKEKCHFHKVKMDEIQQNLNLLEESVQKTLTSLDEKKNQLTDVDKAVKDYESLITEQEHKILDITSRQVQIKNKLTEVMKEIQGCLARKRRLEQENSKVIEEKVQVDNKLSEINRKMGVSTDKIHQLSRQLSIQNNLLGQKNSELAALDQVIDDLEKRKLSLASQKEFIEKLSVQYQDIPDPIVEGQLYTDAPPLDHHTGIIGKVKAVSAVGTLKAAALRSGHHNAAKQLYEIQCETKFIELDPQQVAMKIKELDQQITEKNSLRIELLNSVEEQKLIINQFNIAVQEEEKQISVFNAQQTDVLGEADKISGEIDLVNKELEEVTGILSTTKRNETDLITQLDSLNQELGFSQIKIKENQDAIVTQSHQRENLKIAIAQIQIEAASVNDKKTSHLTNLELYKEALDNSLGEIKRLNDEHAEYEKKKEQFVKDIECLQEKIQVIQEQKVSLKTVSANYEKQREEISQKINGIRSNIYSYNEEINQIKEDLHSRQFQEQEISYKDKEIKERLRQTYKIDLDEFNRQMTENTAVVSDVSGQEGQVAAGEDIQKPQVEQLLEGEDLRIEIERLRKRCDSFGSVNLVAIEEYEELKERFEFLTKQQSDLITAKEQLHQTINKINRQTRQMFMDTFTKVSEEFRIYFRMLFGGGEAQLVLLDPENVLESGIEIIARPPGKKLQNITLLSGGEKSLTAIALIFGVFKVNPSPFCVLDEIDAALDESNVGRFSYLLKDFAKIAQFIVITHNKKTIASADIMYGITMQQTGVSKLVSVKFDKKNGEEQPQEIAVAAAGV